MTLSFTTPRLNIFEISSDIPKSEIQCLLTKIPTLLTPVVVKSLPPYFHNIKSKSDAHTWLEKMLAESRFFVVSQSDLESAIGFMFAFVENTDDVHIGYLLGEKYWGQGFASELLRGFITQTAKKENWVRLVAGVERANEASLKLLLKLGFVEDSIGKEEVVILNKNLSN